MSLVCKCIRVLQAISPISTVWQAQTIMTMLMTALPYSLGVAVSSVVSVPSFLNGASESVVVYMSIDQGAS